MIPPVSYRSLFLLLWVVVVPLYGLKPENPVLGKNFDHWAFKPVKRAVPPLVEGSPNAIDSFVRFKLSQSLLDPSPAASKAVLFRRLSFDLTGLPPSFEQIREFENDERSDAYEQAVDNFLSSPRFRSTCGGELPHTPPFVVVCQSIGKSSERFVKQKTKVN